MWASTAKFFENPVLGHRERQIVEAVYRLGEASVGDVLKELSDPPSYSTIRTMMGSLVSMMIVFRPINLCPSRLDLCAPALDLLDFFAHHGSILPCCPGIFLHKTTHV